VTAEEVVLGALFAGVTLYALLGGADFGAGVWQALAAGRATPEEREQVHAAIGPVWEANHVWLIFVLVTATTAYPGTVASLADTLWLPLLLALAGIVLRGAGFAFRPRDPLRRREARAWEALFAAASVAAPFFLGCALGATAAGAEGGWASPLSLCAGVLAVVICAHLAAVYLARESAISREPALLARWRARALASGFVLMGAAAACLFVLAADAPRLWDRFVGASLPFVALSFVAGGVAARSVAVGRHATAVAASAVATSSVLWGWFAAGHPLLAKGREGGAAPAVAPEAVMVATAWTVSIGAAVVLPCLLLLLNVFKSSRAASLSGERPASNAGPDRGARGSPERPQ
jgi:cytochrome d ubiquinol oxidase subunit II